MAGISCDCKSVLSSRLPGRCPHRDRSCRPPSGELGVVGLTGPMQPLLLHSWTRCAHVHSQTATQAGAPAAQTLQQSTPRMGWQPQQARFPSRRYKLGTKGYDSSPPAPQPPASRPATVCGAAVGPPPDTTACMRSGMCAAAVLCPPAGHLPQPFSLTILLAAVFAAGRRIRRCRCRVCVALVFGCKLEVWRRRPQQHGADAHPVLAALTGQQGLQVAAPRVRRRPPMHLLRQHLQQADRHVPARDAAGDWAGWQAGRPHSAPGRQVEVHKVVAVEAGPAHLLTSRATRIAASSASLPPTSSTCSPCLQTCTAPLFASCLFPQHPRSHPPHPPTCK